MRDQRVIEALLDLYDKFIEEWYLVDVPEDLPTFTFRDFMKWLKETNA